ncbi:DUF1992 domain-containing protein [Mangrovicoccus sp. HB161399]|uniref:DnaJ family domain-containing protein n=1 Tax=Mangrovicoccus sp. HB161399 TaxID=2720392 RepID=UPI001556BEEB|nr:DUF1992 domain-containing protein [Mangrovicoccus sp. HB161399]
MKFRIMAERQIRKAEAQGQFDNLPGAGKPLPATDPDTAEAAGFRIMAREGALPREIQLKKEIEAQRRILAEAQEPETRKAAMARLADLEMRHAIECEARRAWTGRD